MNLNFILVILGLLALSVTADSSRFSKHFNLKKHKGFRTDNFTANLDHFNPGDDRTFNQRFFYSTEHYNQKSGPIFIYICGEYECSVRPDRMFPYEVGKYHKSLFVYVEHRYYGTSHPFPDLKTDNLRHLTSRHALADLALFITSLQEYIQEHHGGNPRKVIVVGGSYPGAMSAWFKAKYPHLADASWASSAVVNAVADFYMFDYQIYNSTSRSSSICANVINMMNLKFDEAVANNKTLADDIKGIFNASSLPDGDFAFFFADIFVHRVQYGERTGLCEFIETISKSSDMSRYHKLAEYNEGVIKPDSYDRAKLKDTTIVPAKSSRQWTYQYCTEFGYFQTPAPTSRMRSNLLNYTFWVEYCQDIFGEDIVLRSNETNTEYGSIDLKSFDIYFTNGGEDPWQWAGVSHGNKALNNVAKTMQCENCAHCVEMYNESEDDSRELQEVRRDIQKWIKKILYGWWWWLY